MHIMLFIISFFFFIGCSFKSSEDKNKTMKNYQELTANDLIKIDSDGDMLNDLDEQEKGLNPFIANIPELQISFLQNYSIKAEGIERNNPSSRWEFTIDTKVGRNDPDFKYRVGGILIRDKSLESAAKIGKYSIHTWDDIEDNDLTWVKYPAIDPSFYHNQVIKNIHYFDEEYDLEKITLQFENSIKLLSSKLYPAIKNLELSFYYYDYERESYERIGSTKIERHFHGGINETFEVTLESVPKNLIYENYLKRGEFIFSKIDDFEIPSLSIKYSQLLASVKNKSLPVVYNTPLESKIYYVGLNSGQKKFEEILQHLFDKNYTIENDELIKIYHFKNDLKDFENLSELKNKEKEGKWFVFTNKLRMNYLDHEFNNKNIISLSYVTGKELSQQSADKIFSYRKDAYGGNDFIIYPLGIASTNSEVDFQIFPKRRWGKKFLKNKLGFLCREKSCKCHYDINQFIERDEQFKFEKSLEGEFSLIHLMINDDEFELKKLIEEKKINVKWINDALHINIKSISAIKELDNNEEHSLSIKVINNTGVIQQGVEFTKMAEGYSLFYCAEVVIRAAYDRKISISSDSWRFDELTKQRSWRNWVKYCRNCVRLSYREQYNEYFSIALSALINNFHN
ncbi:MAG: hypothetical protein JNM93_09180 [Bacteriovoracaceae bacterium]|nr:hypothetical protein [Bacteriovoracaceae bacterium]